MFKLNIGGFISKEAAVGGLVSEFQVFGGKGGPNHASVRWGPHVPFGIVLLPFRKNHPIISIAAIHNKSATHQCNYKVSGSEQRLTSNHISVHMR